jgi:hypothetical protein
MAEKIASKKGATHTISYIVVRGRGDFTDMCRYDNCAPADEGQSMKIDKLREPGGDEGTIILKRFVPAGMSMEPSTGRWKSFGYEVLSHNGKSWWQHPQQAEDALVTVDERRVQEAARRLGQGQGS